MAHNNNSTINNSTPTIQPAFNCQITYQCIEIPNKWKWRSVLCDFPLWHRHLFHEHINVSFKIIEIENRISISNQEKILNNDIPTEVIHIGLLRPKKSCLFPVTLP